MNKDERTPLRRAVDALIADGKIKQDKDLQEMFGLKKSTISAYLNNPKPGKRFIIEFEKRFGISLDEFHIDHTLPKDKDAKITALQYENLRLRLENVESNLNAALSNQKVIMTMLTVAMSHAADFFSSGNKAKADALRRKMMTDIASAQEKIS